jgi:hypothetical protein
VPDNNSALKVSAFSAPLPSPSANTSLQDADPSVFFALDWFSYLINNYLGARIAYEAAQCGLLTPDGKPIQAVAQRYPYLLTDAQLQENQFKFPLLSLGRTRTLTGRKTAGWEHDRGFFDLVYALPPLFPGQTERLLPLLQAVYATLRKKTTFAWDPGYTPPGGTLGQQWTSAGLANLEAVGFGDPFRDLAESATFGFLEGTGNLFMPCVRMQGYFLERDMYVASSNKFLGGDIQADLVASDGTVSVAFELASTTQTSPTITGLSNNSGPIAGGTLVIITGTSFVKGATVSFGNTPAVSVVWNSATQITCNAPAVQGAGTLPITVTNPPIPVSPGVASDLAPGQQFVAQSVTLQTAFTYF